MTASPPRRSPGPADLWIYDLRTNQRFTLKRRPLTYDHLPDFIEAYCPNDRSARVETERFRRFSYDDLHISRDRANLDIFWLRDAAR